MGKSPTKSSPRKKSIAAEDQVEPKQRGRILSIINNWKSKASQEHERQSDPVLEEDVYGGLDGSLTVLIHGLESDWIEEEMTDDDDFKYKAIIEYRCISLKHLNEGKMSWKSNFKSIWIQLAISTTSHSRSIFICHFEIPRDKMNDHCSIWTVGLKAPGTMMYLR